MRVAIQERVCILEGTPGVIFRVAGSSHANGRRRAVKTVDFCLVTFFFFWYFHRMSIRVLRHCAIVEFRTHVKNFYREKWNCQFKRPTRCRLFTRVYRRVMRQSLRAIETRPAARWTRGTGRHKWHRYRARRSKGKSLETVTKRSVLHCHFL